MLHAVEKDVVGLDRRLLHPEVVGVAIRVGESVDSGRRHRVSVEVARTVHLRVVGKQQEVELAR